VRESVSESQLQYRKRLEKLYKSDSSIKIFIVYVLQFSAREFDEFKTDALSKNSSMSVQISSLLVYATRSGGVTILPVWTRRAVPDLRKDLDTDEAIRHDGFRFFPRILNSIQEDVKVDRYRVEFSWSVLVLIGFSPFAGGVLATCE
jgi:hypothetical protein